jgi:hypothetical protein
MRKRMRVDDVPTVKKTEKAAGLWEEVSNGLLDCEAHVLGVVGEERRGKRARAGKEQARVRGRRSGEKRRVC